MVIKSIIIAGQTFHYIPLTSEHSDSIMKDQMKNVVALKNTYHEFVIIILLLPQLFLLCLLLCFYLFK